MAEIDYELRIHNQKMVFQKILSGKLMQNIRVLTCTNIKNTELVITKGNIIVPQISVSDNATELVTKILHPREIVRIQQGDPNGKNMHDGHTTVTKAKPRTKRLLLLFNPGIDTWNFLPKLVSFDILMVLLQLQPGGKRIGNTTANRSCH